MTVTNDDVHPKHDRRPAKTTKFDRPTEATLIVRLANGDEWPAKIADLTAFGYVDLQTARYAVTQAFRQVGLDDEADGLSEIRYAIERAIESNPLGTWDGKFRPDDHDSLAQATAAAERIGVAFHGDDFTRAEIDRRLRAALEYLGIGGGVCRVDTNRTAWTADEIAGAVEAYRTGDPTHDTPL